MVWVTGEFSKRNEDTKKWLDFCAGLFVCLFVCLFYISWSYLGRGISMKKIPLGGPKANQ
jgi:hypothetical protein